MNQSQRTASRRGRAVALAVLATIACAVPADAFAQAVQAAVNTRNLTGVVEDVRGLPLLGAFVAVIPLGSDQPEGIAVTDVRGHFAFENLREGVYTLLVGSLGFAGTVVQGINVPGALPVSLQLEPQGERDLAMVNAPLDLGWALRSGKRDALRSTEATLIAEGGDVDSTPQGYWAPASSAEPLTTSMTGEFRLWSFSNTGDERSVGVTSIALGGGESWNLSAHVGDRGAIWAASDVTRDLGSGHTLRVGFGYVGGDFDFLKPNDTEETDSWIGRLQVADSWRVSRALEVTVGAAYEHHTYLASSALISPRFEVAISPFRKTRLFTGVSYDAEGLDLADSGSGFELVSLLGQSNLLVADTQHVRPEKSVRYEVGVEQQIGDAEVRMAAYYDDVTDELLGVYVADPAGINNYLLFNVGDTRARGFELALAARLMESVSGEVSYAYRNREKPYGALPVAGGELPEGIGDWQQDETHELQASVAARVEPLRTNVLAVYHWKAGMPVIRDGRLRDAFGRFDLRLRQPLPFHALDSEWSAMVQIRNVLGPEYDGLYNVSLAELLGLNRGIAGGLAVKF